MYNYCTLYFSNSLQNVTQMYNLKSFLPQIAYALIVLPNNALQPMHLYSLFGYVWYQNAIKANYFYWKRLI